MTTIEILKAARARLAVPERWTQGAGARRRDGSECWPVASDAVCWCIRGALARSGDYWAGTVALRAIAAIVGDAPAHWNDDPERTHAEVLDALGRTMASLGGEP